DRVHHEWRDLVERHALLPSGRAWRHLLVGVEAAGPEAAEDAQHREIDLAVPAVGRRIDQPVPTVAAHEAVAGPEVAVQPRRWLVGATEPVESFRDPCQSVDR